MQYMMLQAGVLLAAVGTAAVAGQQPPSELCANYRDWSRCVHIKEFDTATNESLVMDISDGLCYTYVSGKKTTKEACGAGSLRFTWHQPHPNMFKAIGVSGDLCLDTTRGGHKLWECGDEKKANQHYYAGWRSQYTYPCEVFSVSSKEKAQQCGCVARDEQLHASAGVEGRVRVYQHCLEGRIRGGLGGRVMSSLYPENVCDGQPMPMHSLGDWTADDTMFVYWAEDADNWTTAGTHIERVRFTAAGAEVVGHIKLPQCVHNGAVARGRDGKLAVVCAEAAGWDKWLHLKVVEVEVDLSKEVRRFSVLPEGCRATGGCKGAYPMQKGADFRLLQYSASRDWYFVFHNAEWGGHVADAVTVWDGETGAQVRGYGDSWACMGGHTETGRMAYNAEADELAVLCCSDLGGACQDPAKGNCDVDNKWRNGLVFRTHVANKQSVTLAPFANVYNQAISGWLGDLLPCDDGYVLAWHGADGLAETFRNKTNNVGFMRVSATGEVLAKKWITATADARERSVKLAKLGKGSCDRFLLGWGDMAANAYYPSRYLLVEVDKDGEELTQPLDVTNATMWGEDTQWATLGNGDVAWGHTWKRNIDGTPNKVGQTPYKKPAGRSCTWNGNGYGYTWGSLSDRPGGRFHTNEAFTTRYAAAAAGGVGPATGAPSTGVPATAAPATEAPETRAPATPSPQTDVPPTRAPPAPSTKSPATDAPATDAPSTTAPSTDAPLTTSPTTSAPATIAPSTKAPATSAPPTTAPSTTAPSTEAPATIAPSTTAPATEAPATDAPSTKAPSTSAPATGSPPTTAPATNAPATTAPSTKAPATNAPATDAPSTTAPSTDAPLTTSPTTSAPATSAPPTTAPSTTAPSTEAPATIAPSTKAPATEAPATDAPSTKAPTTSAPATGSPPTTAPATNAPATDAPLTTAPSTPAPPTEAPATNAPSTKVPATKAPTSTAPETEVPATRAPKRSRKFTYLGCFHDKWDRALTGASNLWGRYASPSRCYRFCKKRGFTYFGLQGRRMCFCGNADDEYDRHGAARRCNMRCSRGRAMCGGRWRSSVYEILR